MLVAFVVVNVSAEDHNAVGRVSLAFLEHLGECLLWRARRMTSAELSGVRGTRIRWVVEHYKDEIDICRNVVELGRQPVALRA